MTSGNVSAGARGSRTTPKNEYRTFRAALSAAFEQRSSYSVRPSFAPRRCPSSRALGKGSMRTMCSRIRASRSAPDGSIRLAASSPRRLPGAMSGSSPRIVSTIVGPISCRNAAPLALRSSICNAMPGAATGVSVDFFIVHLWQARHTFALPYKSSISKGSRSGLSGFGWSLARIRVSLSS